MLVDGFAGLAPMPDAEPGNRNRKLSIGQRPRVSLIVPTLNEARNVAWVLERLPACVEEVIVVDGRSTDDTIDVALRVRPDARIVLESRPGKGAALRAGFAAARGEYVTMIDADGSMHPAEIESFVAALAEGSDFVKGSRFLSGGGTSDMSAIRKLGNAGLREAVNTLYGARFTDLCYGFMAFRRDRLQALNLESDGFEIETEIVVRAILAGLRITEVPSFEAERIHGESNLRAWHDGRRVLTTVLRERRATRRGPQPDPQLRLTDLRARRVHAVAPPSDRTCVAAALWRERRDRGPFWV
jgi:glycosyltransferase involved in cell wall biosynthesis